MQILKANSLTKAKLPILIAIIAILLAIVGLSCAKSEEELLNELNSDDANVRLSAISVLLDRGNPAAKHPEVIDWLVTSSANLLNDSANWINRDQARKFYDTLKKIEGELVIKSLVRHLFKPEIRLRVLYLGVKLGIEGSEEELIEVLNSRGNKTMAEDFLNSGSSKLSNAAEDWAKSMVTRLLRVPGAIKPLGVDFRNPS